MVGIDAIVILIWLIAVYLKCDAGYYQRTDEEPISLFKLFKHKLFNKSINQQNTTNYSNNLGLRNLQSLVWIRLKNYTAERAIDYSFRLKDNRL